MSVLVTKMEFLTYEELVESVSYQTVFNIVSEFPVKFRRGDAEYFAETLANHKDIGTDIENIALTLTHIGFDKVRGRWKCTLEKGNKRTLLTIIFILRVRGLRTIYFSISRGPYGAFVGPSPDKEKTLAIIPIEGFLGRVGGDFLNEVMNSIWSSNFRSIIDLYIALKSFASNKENETVLNIRSS